MAYLSPNRDRDHSAWLAPLRSNPFSFAPMVTPRLIRFFFGALLVWIATPCFAEITLDSLPARSREQLEASLHFADRFWDESAGLLNSPAEGEKQVHRVRESAWYALGLLIRNQNSDQARAVRIIENVLAQQFDAPGQPWNGTYRRAPEEADPPAQGAQPWDHYDPNWREFIGCTFSIILMEFEPRLPAKLPKRMLDSIRRAVDGELGTTRLVPSYTNIALMHGFIWSYAAKRLDLADWREKSDAWCNAVYELYKPNESFSEYNSPTYYGVDLFGLALWRRHGPTEKIRAMGAEMEAGLWRDVGRFYHAGMKNLCGPFDRAYGMDTRKYVSLVGAWMSLALPPELTPLPDPKGPMDHAHDFLFIPNFVCLGPQIPADVLASFHEFKGERTLRRPIEGPRVATAWLSDRLMIGGEITGATRAAGPGTKYNQAKPATAHWQIANGELGWIALVAAPVSDAQASAGKLELTAPTAGDFTFQIHAAGAQPNQLRRDHWLLPALDVRIDADTLDYSVTPGPEFITVQFRGATRLSFQFLAIKP